MARSYAIADRTGFSAPGFLASIDIAGTVGALALAVVVTALPLIGHLAGQPFGIFLCCALAAIVANCAPAKIPVLLLFAYMFQNFFVSLLTPEIGNIDQFNSIRSYNFILTAVIWLVVVGRYWFERDTIDERLRSIMNLTFIALFGIGFYFCIGVLTNPVGATVYLRNITTPIFLFQVFAIVAYRNRITIAGALIVIAAVALLCGYLELLDNEAWFRLIHGDGYFKWATLRDYEAGTWLKELKENGRVYRGYLDTTEVDFLNTPLLGDLGLKFHRLVGPNFHPISFAYVLAFFAIVLSALGQWWYLILAIPLLLVIGSKGSLLFVTTVILALALTRRIRAPWVFWLYTALLVAYIAVAIPTGIRAGDYHVIGFMGGLKGFLKDPIGHGIGVGGNLSVNMTAIDWSRFQQQGETDVAVESAVGVLLYQMGVAGALLLALQFWIARKAWTFYAQSGNRIFGAASLGLLSILANGFFQEEALFAPLALGIVLALTGLLLGRSYRPAEVSIHPGSERTNWRSP